MSRQALLFNDLFGDEEYEDYIVQDSYPDTERGSQIPLEDDDLVQESYPDTERDSQIPIGDEDRVEASHPDTVRDSQIPSSGPSEMTLEQGKGFSSVEELFEFYDEYARLKGFAVIKRNQKGKYGVMSCDRGRKTTG